MNEPLIAILDVQYQGDIGYAAGVWFRGWASDLVIESHTKVCHNVAPYYPGAFYKRELPCLLKVLELGPKPDIIVVDGYVWLPNTTNGLGAYLHEELSIPVVGIAKTHYAETVAARVTRGGSKRLIYVTSAGIDTEDAAKEVLGMAGEFRLPTMVKTVDAIARSMSIS